jgi:hypothetical protein
MAIREPQSVEDVLEDPMFVDDAPLPEDLVPKILEQERIIRQGEEIVSGALWQQGDLLFAARLTESQYRKVAQQTHLSRDVLHEREQMARAFTPERRNLKVSWSVHKVLARIQDEDEQDRLLRSRNDWTVDAMRHAVRKWVEKTGGNVGVVPAFRAGMSVGGIKVTGRRVGDRIEVSIEAPPFGKPQTMTTKNSVTMICELNERKLRPVS